MFREGSNVAIHVLDNIVVEAAGLAFKELKFVAERLRRDALWKTGIGPKTPATVTIRLVLSDCTAVKNASQ